MMSPVLTLDLGLVLLLSIALLLLGYAFLSAGNRGVSRGVRRDTETALFHEATAELALREKEGQLDADARIALQSELEREWLADVESSAVNDHAASDVKPARLMQRYVLWAIAAILMIALVLSCYSWLGARNMVRISALIDDRQALTVADDIAGINAQLLVLLSRELAHHPDSLQARYLRGNTRLETGDIAGAVEDYRLYVAREPRDIRVLAELAQALYLASSRQLTPEVQTVIDQVLQQDPRNGGVLGLLGMHNFELGHYAEAVRYWQQVLASLDPADPTAEIFRVGLAKARELAGSSVDETPALLAAEAGKGIKLYITLAPGIQTSPESIIFVFAKELNGPPMPVAAIRLQASDLPASVILDDSHVIQQGRHLTDYPQLVIGARLSRTGTPMAQTGDIQAKSQVVEQSKMEPQSLIELVIDAPVK